DLIVFLGWSGTYGVGETEICTSPELIYPGVIKEGAVGPELICTGVIKEGAGPELICTGAVT
ncbi:hypothetical protein Tco_0315273, partial [Tanacetum coccineum]